MAAVRALTAAQGAGRMGPAHGQSPPEAPAAQGVQIAQNTQELSLTTPVLFYGKCKDGKSIPPSAFLMELEARQTRHGWEPSMLLRFVKSCLRGESALWWEGCILSYGDDQDQGPAETYATFKVAFKVAFMQHYGIGGATNNLCWADTFRQRSDEDIREYFSRSTAELGNHLKESAPLLYGKTYTPVDINVNGDNTITRVRNRRAMGHDFGSDATWCQEIEQCVRDATAKAKRAAKSELEKYRKNYHAFLTSQAIMQGITKDGARSYAAEQVDKRGDTLYTDRRMMLLLMDKIVEFERTDKSRRNLTIAEATLAEEDGAIIEAVKANKKKGKGKGKDKGKGNIADTNVAAMLPPPRGRPQMQILRQGWTRRG
jgi:hypothetical protein